MATAEGAIPMDLHAVAFAVRQIAAYPGVSLLSEPQQTPRGLDVMFQFDLEFGRRWSARGESPTGVRPLEEVRLSFPDDFPASPPEISLRSDFSREHPHIQPYLSLDGRVVPCVIDAPMKEFLAASGYSQLAAQTMLWLTRAAEGTLMSGASGWEPARRDNVNDILLLNEEVIRANAGRTAGHAYYETSFRTSDDGKPRKDFLGALIKRSTAREALKAASERSGIGLGLVVWGGAGNSQADHSFDQYLPDDVQNVGELLQRAELFGLKERLTKVLPHLDVSSKVYRKLDVPLVVLLLVRRPRPLIGSDSPIEIFGYVLPRLRLGGALDNASDVVRPLGLRGSVEPGVLRRMSGTREMAPWALLGAGSLGSKVALHLAREANSPCIVADPAMLSPHNAARHSLYPERAGEFSGWLQGKANALSGVLGAFGNRPRAVTGDHRQLVSEIRGMKVSERPAWVVNTTASLHVRESLSRTEYDDIPPVVDMTLFGRAAVGYVAIEGPAKNPNSLELVAELYHIASTDRSFGTLLFGESPASRVVLGQGCGSFTTIMSDARLSVQAAVMTETFGSLRPGDGSSIRIILKTESLGLDIRHIEVSPFVRVPVEGLEGWSVSMPERVVTKMKSDMGSHPNTETGGVIIGYTSLTARRIVITDIVCAPPDSKRTASSFILGTSGLEDRLSKIEAESSGVLRRLGTWHSHLGAAEPSAIDRKSAELVADGASGPMVLLVKGNDGFRAISQPPKLPAPYRTDPDGDQ